MPPSTDSSRQPSIDAILAAALDAVITIDDRGHVVEWNPAAEQIFGHPRSAALGRPVADLVVPGSLRPAHDAGVKRVAAGGRPRILGRRHTFSGVHTSGQEFPVELTVTQTAHAPARFTAWIRKLSDRSEVEAKAKRPGDAFELAERLAKVGTGKRDLHTGDGEWSEGMYRIHGLEPDEVAPSIEQVVARAHPEDRERLDALTSSVFEQAAEVPEDGLTFDYRTLASDGSIRAVRVRGRVEAGEDGTPPRWVAAAQDVTAERATERELQAHHAVSQALDEWASFEEGSQNLLQLLGTALECAFGALWTWDTQQQRLVSRAFWRAPGIEQGRFEDVSRTVSYVPGHGIPGRAWATRRPALFEDVLEALGWERRNAAAEAGIRSAVAFPAVADDGPLAVLSFYSLDRRAPGERVARTLTGIGSELGRFLTHRHADLASLRLSQREHEVLALAAEGNTGPEIAERLGVSPETVKTHFENIYEKLGVSDRAAAVARALRTGLLH